MVALMEPSPSLMQQLISPDGEYTMMLTARDKAEMRVNHLHDRLHWIEQHQML